MDISQSTHPTEPLLEAILTNQDKNAKSQESVLEAILVNQDYNAKSVEPILEASLVKQDEIVKAIKDKPEVHELNLKGIEVITLKGDKGDKGENGDKGEKGDSITGKQGIQGETGDKGDKGEKGDKGADGKTGPQGIPGNDGSKGERGEMGPQGIPGKTLSQEDIDKIASGLNKTKKENFLFANQGESLKNIIDYNDSSAITPDCNRADIVVLRSLSQTTVFANPIGSPRQQKQLEIMITSASVQNISFGTLYSGSTTIPLPTQTSGGGKTDHIGLRFNIVSGKWECLATSFGYA